MNCRILIVDDSSLLRATARRAALQAGVPADCIREAVDGADALVQLRTAPVDLVLLDLNMPVLDGFQFMQAKVREPGLASVAVALVTTESNRDRLARMRELGAQFYLHKPFAPEDLRSLIAQLVADRS